MKGSKLAMAAFVAMYVLVVAAAWNLPIPLYLVTIIGASVCFVLGQVYEGEREKEREAIR